MDYHSAVALIKLIVYLSIMFAGIHNLRELDKAMKKIDNLRHEEDR